MQVIAMAGMKSLEEEKALPEEGVENYDVVKTQVETDNEQIK